MKRVLIPALLLLAVVALIVATVAAKKHSDQQGWLGVYTQSVTYEIAEAFDLDVRYGAVVNEVVDDSPADKAGLRDGDVIVAMNGEKVTDADDLTDLMIETAPGDKIQLTVMRDGDEMALAAVAGEKPETEEDEAIWYFDDDDGVAPLPFIHFNSDHPYLGVYLDNLSEQLGDYFGVDEGRGALVTEVDQDSPAQKAGLKAGDVITEIAGEKVTDPSDVVEALQDHEAGDQVVLTAIRDRRAGQYTVELAERDKRIHGRTFRLAPDMAQIKIPKVRGLYLGDSDAALGWDAETQREFEREMKQLSKELSRMKIEFGDRGQGAEDSDLRKDLQQLREDLTQLKEELREELRRLESDNN